MKLRILYIVLVAVVFSACQTAEKTNTYTQLSDSQLLRVADSLAQAYIIIDGHVDLPYRLSVKNFRLERDYLGIPVSTTEGDFDYERAKKGGLDAPFMSISIPRKRSVASSICLHPAVN